MARVAGLRKVDTDKLKANELSFYVNGVVKASYINGIATGYLESSGSIEQLMLGDVLEIKTDNPYVKILGITCFFDNKFNDFTIVNNKAKFVFGAGDGSDSNINLSIKIDYRPVRYKFNAVDSKILDDSKCTILKNSNPMTLGDVAYDGDLLEIKTVGDYEFLEPPYFYVTDRKVSKGTYKFLLDSKKSANLLISLFKNDYLDYRDISKLKIFTQQKDGSKGSNNLFIVDNDQVKSINAERFRTINMQGGTTDYGVNIIGLLNLPFVITNDFILDPEKIILGTLQTNVIAPKVKSDRYIYSFGDIKAPIPVTLIDYENTKAILYLPYTDPLELPLDFVLGFTVKVDYVVDLYTGIAEINVLSSKNNAVFATKNVNLGIKIPHSGENGDRQFVENLNIVMGGDNFIRKPFIEIQRYEPILANGIFSNVVLDEKSLIGEVGFIEVENIKLQSNATSEEKHLIVNALKSGVIIS